MPAITLIFNKKEGLKLLLNTERASVFCQETDIHLFFLPGEDGRIGGDVAVTFIQTDLKQGFLQGPRGVRFSDQDPRRDLSNRETDFPHIDLVLLLTRGSFSSFYLNTHQTQICGRFVEKAHRTDGLTPGSSAQLLNPSLLADGQN